MVFTFDNAKLILPFSYLTTVNADFFFSEKNNPKVSKEINLLTLLLQRSKLKIKTTNHTIILPLPITVNTKNTATRLRCFFWWTLPGSNRLPLPCHGSALPDELWARLRTLFYIISGIIFLDNRKRGQHGKSQVKER